MQGKNTNDYFDRDTTFDCNHDDGFACAWNYLTVYNDSLGCIFPQKLLFMAPSHENCIRCMLFSNTKKFPYLRKKIYARPDFPNLNIVKKE